MHFLLLNCCVSNTGIITFQVATFNIIPLIIVCNWNGLMGMNPNCFLDLWYVNPDFTFAVRWILGLFHWIVMILPEPWLNSQVITLPVMYCQKNYTFNPLDPERIHPKHM